MSLKLAAEYLLEHYPNAAERRADWWIHILGLTAAAVGAVFLVSMAVRQGTGAGLAGAAALYATGLVTMLACSAAYNFSRVSPARPFLRRLDEAGIFLMIACSYTPFTTQRFTGNWAVGMTALVWFIAALGIIGKLTMPKISERAWTGLYVAFGWVAIIALRPMLHGVPMFALALLVVGGLLYTIGAMLFLNPALPYRRAVWHTFVVSGAATHYAAILLGVVLAGPIRGLG
jgi:hemolysin III